MRTQVAIVGGGPSGMLLAHLLAKAGIESVVIEQRSRAYVLDRVRAGVLEHGSVELLRSIGVGERMDREGFVHDGTELSNNGQGFRIDFKAVSGRAVMVYGQTEVQKDLYDIGDRKGLVVHDDCGDVAVHDPTSATPSVTFTKDGQPHRVHADFIAGCDGFHGVCRTVFPASMITEFERVYPFGWLGVLSETPPVSHELIYARHPDGFALCSMRNPMLSRYYIQCTAETKAADWSDQQFWDALRHRLPAEAAETMVTGPSIEKSVTPLRSYVREPLRYGNLFLAGDSAHIVPPTGAKGLNLAFSDIFYLSRALVEHYDEHSDAGLDHYSALALKRVWKAVRFSWWMTTMLHTFGDQTQFDHRMQETELDYLASSPAAQAAMAEQYTGIPY
jgi:p-hydroxybenzoate 3-monooxygenase